jgi:hypothetical protein
MKTIKAIALIIGVMSLTTALDAVWLSKESIWNRTGYSGGFQIPDGDYTKQSCYVIAYYDNTTGDLHTECFNKAGGLNGSVFINAKSKRCNIVNCDGILECEEGCPGWRRMAQDSDITQTNL